MRLQVDPLSEKPPISVAGADPFSFETPLFKGMMLFRLKSDMQPASAPYFEGLKRRQSVVFTGQFKQEVPFAHLLSGQEFCHSIRNPGAMMSKALLSVIKTLAPLLQCHIPPPDSEDSSVYFLSPLAQSVMTMKVSQHPYALSADCAVEEDTRLLGGPLAAGMDSKQRKKFFSTQKVDDPIISPALLPWP